MIGIHLLIIFFLSILQESFLQIFSIKGFVPNLALAYLFAILYFDKYQTKNDKLFFVYVFGALIIDWMSGFYFPSKFIYLLIAYKIIDFIYSNFSKSFLSFLISSFLAFCGYFVYNNLVISFFEKNALTNPIYGFYFAAYNIFFSVLFYFLFSHVKKIV